MTGISRLILLITLTACGTGRPATGTPVPTLNPNSAEGRGQVLFTGKGRCTTCHSLSEGTVIVGPSLAGIGTRAATRRPTYAAQDYLEESILLPDAYKAPGFESIQMDTSLAKTLTTEEITDLVAYLMTLK